MGHEGAINHQALTREILAGADAWQGCDRSTAVNRLRAGFEVLTQARERFYPVDAYLVDLCLLDPAMPGGVLAGPLDSHVAISFLPPALAIENQVSRDPAGMERLRQAISEGWVDVAGGQYAEAENLVLPLESILWQFRRGSEVYRAHLEERNVETFAAAVRVVYATAADRQAVWIAVRCCTSGSTPAASRSVPRSSGSGRARTGPAWRPCSDRRWRPIGPRGADDRLVAGRDDEERPCGDVFLWFTGRLRWPCGIAISGGCAPIRRCSADGSRSTITFT